MDWYLNYEDWIIGDGEPDFAVNDVFDWRAIRISSNDPLRRTDQRIKTATSTPSFRYEVFGEVTHRSARSCLIDIGPLLGVGDSSILASDCSERDYVHGVVHLGLPLVTEFAPDVPVIPQRWKVKHIFADLTPYIKHSERFRVIDESRRRHQEVSSTSAVKAHTYILQCEHIGIGDKIPGLCSGVVISSPQPNE